MQSPNINSYIGNSPVDNSFVPDTTARHTLGTAIEFIDPYWGPQKLIYAKAAAAFKVGQCVYFDVVSGVLTATSVPNTANLGYNVAFAKSKMDEATYGWFIISGRALALSGASVAADAKIGITAAGTLGAVAAGKQILGAHVYAAATTTVAKTLSTTSNGSTTIKVKNTDGWFVGMALSGTGVGASAVVSSIAPDGQSIEASVASSASGVVTVTGTYNDSTDYWNVLTLNAPHAQGQDATA
jgi:hypothetical protein